MPKEISRKTDEILVSGAVSPVDQRDQSNFNRSTGFDLQFGFRLLSSEANNVPRPKQLNLLMDTPAAKHRLRATLDYQQDRVLLEWVHPSEGVRERVEVKSTGFNCLEWRNTHGVVTSLQSSSGSESVKAAVARLLGELPADEIDIGGFYVDALPRRRWDRIAPPPGVDRWQLLIDEIHRYAVA